MSAFFLAFLTCLLATLPGREALLHARLADAGASGGVLAIGWITAGLTALLSAWLAGLVAPFMNGNARLMLVAFALAAAGLELALRRHRSAPKEPTRSLGAVTLVLLAGQVGDASRFLVFALAAFTAAPLNVTLGGMAGCGAAFTLAWLAGEDWEQKMPLRTLRFAIAGLLVLAALACAATARGIIG
ncbi:TMEM165/GDT1 family protein [Paraurantiacibacter namhicola]|uniref:GDT1 family protein n=1 Tax=Paraurantiacibacter namhicola TaxID=645517 RepID=A0A1C7D7C6_9SPHN|nr:TMEM165/GDT1 family protein [Paraurantiacibacter namhicola]ANU07231.1 hypothetical protein A6F65_00921 [Paraurantiacibacter namhicola]